MRDDLPPNPEPDLVALADRLTALRPVPRAAFRGDLGRHLASRERRGFTVSHARALILSYSLAGIALLGAGTLSAAGVGPLG